MLKTAGDSNSNTARLLKFAELFVDNVKKQESSPLLQTTPANFDVVIDVLDNMVLFFQAIICLLSPIPGHLASNIDHVENILSKRSDDFFLEAELQDHMRN